MKLIGDFANIAKAYESVSNAESSFRLYRGIDAELTSTDGLDGNNGTGNIFTTDDAGYAKTYALLHENPAIIEYSVDNGRIRIATTGTLDGIFDREFDVQTLYDGLDRNETEMILDHGYNCVMFTTEDQSHDIYCILDYGIIKSRRVLSDEEFDEIDEEE